MVILTKKKKKINGSRNKFRNKSKFGNKKKTLRSRKNILRGGKTPKINLPPPQMPKIGEPPKNKKKSRFKIGAPSPTPKIVSPYLSQNGKKPIQYENNFNVQRIAASKKRIEGRELSNNEKTNIQAGFMRGFSNTTHFTPGKSSKNKSIVYGKEPLIYGNNSQIDHKNQLHKIQVSPTAHSLSKKILQERGVSPTYVNLPPRPKKPNPNVYEDMSNAGVNIDKLQYERMSYPDSPGYGNLPSVQKDPIYSEIEEPIYAELN